ncbi:MAG: allophanate hydrolase subunit 1 [Isosphaeraceae bacterium]|nr:allophanate hydrolase subunit 1 [Isosphaeraceae bacterium]
MDDRVDRFPATVRPLGDRAWLAEFEAESEAIAWAEAVARMAGTGIEVVPAHRTVAVIADADRTEWELAELEKRLARIPVGFSGGTATVRLHEIPVLYDGPDLLEVAESLEISPRAVVDLHTSVEYTTLAVGFQPGFPYLGRLPTPLDRIGRRDSPRTRVAAGSVAIAAGRTGIYPIDSPGGWRILGWTPTAIVDLEADFFLFSPGDRVRFRPIDASRILRAGSRQT